MKRLWLGVLGAAAALACSDGPTGPAWLNGFYSYTAADSGGTVLLLGQLDLVFRSDSSVTGSWTITWAPGVDGTTEVGPQVGSGTLRGRLAPGDIFLDLNPGVADNNVFLAGAFVPQNMMVGFGGGWSYSTLVGPVAAGPFTAVKILPD